MLRGRKFRSLYLVRLIGQACDGLVQTALATFVLFSPERQSTPAQVAATFAILLLPYSLIGPFVGVFLDRWRRRQVLVWANLARAAVLVLVGIAVAGQHTDLFLGATVLIALGINRFVLAAHSASIPHVVDERYLVTANALVPTSGTLASVVGGLLGFGIRALTGGGDRGAAIVIGVAVIGVVGAALAARRIPVDLLGPDLDEVPEQRERVVDVVRGLAEGARHLWARQPAFLAMSVVVLHRVAFGALLVSALLLARSVLHPGDADASLRDFALLSGAAGAGAFVGAVLTPNLTPRVGAVRWSAFTLLIGAVISPIGFLTHNIVGLMIAGAAIGFAGQSVKINGDTIVQAQLEDDYRGRVFAIYDVVLNIGLVTGIFAVAFLGPADGQSVGAPLLIGALLAATAMGYVAASRNAQPS